MSPVSTPPTCHGRETNRHHVWLDEIQRKLQQVYLQSVIPWKTRTLEDAMQIFRKAFDSESDVVPELSACIFNALADMVAAILDSGAIQPQRMELQKELAVDFANQAISVWNDSGSPDGSGERSRCMALLSFIAGTVTAQQVSSEILHLWREYGLTYVSTGRIRHTLH
jgi:hypothetical protein